MKRFTTELKEHTERVDLVEIALPFGLDTTLANIARKAGLTSITNVLTDVFEAGIRLVGKNPLRSAFFAIALDQLVNSGRGRQALIRYLEGDFIDHAGYVLDAIFALMEDGVDSKSATQLVAAAIEAAN